jgi:hypothetical protein
MGAECRFKLYRSDAVVKADGEALRIEIYPEMKLSEDEQPDVIKIYTGRSGLNEIELWGDTLYSKFEGATKGTTCFIDKMVKAYIRSHLLEGGTLEEVDTLKRYLALVMIEAHRKISHVHDIVHRRRRPPRLLRLITLIKYISLRLSILISDIKLYVRHVILRRRDPGYYPAYEYAWFVKSEREKLEGER